ncbi:MAG: PepSY domain-containing protein [Colwellia sp.]
MKLLKNSRKVHRWLMLFLGLQFLIWSVSGAYMVIFDIDYIHGDSLVVNHQTKVDANKITYPISALRQEYPDAQNIAVEVFIDQVVYRFNENDKKVVVNASGGEKLSPLNANEAIKAAKHYYSGDGDVTDVELITENPPFELSSRTLPAWRVNFDDFGSPSIYVSAQTGKLVSKRHEFWRIFDLMFSLHVMDYEEEDPSNQLLFWFTLFSIIASLFGAVLSYFVIFKRSNSNTILGGAK